MVINCYLSPECGAEEGLRTNIALALDLEKVEAQVNYYRIDDEKAAEMGLSGSPSIFIDGNALQPQKSVGFS